MFGFGTIVLTRFPFSDLSGDKRRPALVVSRAHDAQSDVAVCFIASVVRGGFATAPIESGVGTGLRLPSVVRFDELETLNSRVVAGKLGDASPEWLSRHRAEFLNVFGFQDES